MTKTAIRISALCGLLAAVAAACGRSADSPPEVRANADWSAPAVDSAGAARRVVNRAPRQLLSVERTDRAPRGVRILFWDYQPAARDPVGHTFVADLESSRILMLDERLRPVAWRRPTGPGGDRLQRPTMVSVRGGDTLVAFEASGDWVLFDLWGRVFQRRSGPFTVHVGGALPDGRIAVARSPVLFPFNFVEPDAPLLAVLDPLADSALVPIGVVETPAPDFWYTGIALNAGAVAVDSAGAIYFAWLVKPEIRKYDAAGRLVWISERPVGFPLEAPRLVPRGAGQRPTLRLHTVHKAVTIGPDGLLYVRAAADTTGTGDRLEALDPRSGEWLRSAPLDTGTVVVAGPHGRIWEVPRDRIARAREPERRPFTAYALETLAGDTMRLEEAGGRVLIVAFWASWCTPCREELPLLDGLYRGTSRDRFEVHAISDDVDPEAARRFAESLDLSFPVLLGRGRMRERYHYHGLPYTVLVDRGGRVVREFYGFGGRDDFTSKVLPLIRQEIEAER